MVVVDASVWVGVFLPLDAHHRAARRWLEEQVAAGEAIVAPVILLSEIGGAISRQTRSLATATAALRFVEKVPGLRLVPVDHRLGRVAADLAATLRLRGADAVYVAVAGHLKIPLVTLDEEQRERAKALVEVRTPGTSRRSATRQERRP